MIYSLFIIVFIALLSPLVSSFTTGSPRCRATSVTDVVAMNGTDTPNPGFVLSVSSTTYTPNGKLTFTITNPSNTPFLGFLAFVELSNQTQVGAFDDKTGLHFAGALPAACRNTRTVITQADKTPKSVPFTLDWTAPVAGTGSVTARFAIMIQGRVFQFSGIALTEGSVPPPKSSAHQSGPIAIIIGTMMALGLAMIKQF